MKPWIIGDKRLFANLGSGLLGSMLKRRRQWTRVLTLFMLVNITISLLILIQQNRLNNLFFSYFNTIEQTVLSGQRFDLTSVLDAYRQAKTTAITTYTNSLQRDLIDSDYVLSVNTLKMIGANEGRKFYEPRIIINPSSSRCQPQDSSNKLYILFLIHSHKNNRLRRMTMRDTWLSESRFKSNNSSRTLEISHMFVVGSTPDGDLNDQIQAESDAYHDLLVIDSVDVYKNLLYKHLALVGWVSRNCAQNSTTHVVKLDDDVYVNIQTLIDHLMHKFNHSVEIDDHYIYCNINDLAAPVRQPESKWYVSFEAYPFAFYPRYCEGFAYITNVKTMRVMYEQSNLIPRFWIDDVYVSGILLHGLELTPPLRWLDFKTEFIKWAYYDFWEFKQQEQGGVSMLRSILVWLLGQRAGRSLDDYLNNHFVILHVQIDSKKEFNYDLNTSSSLSLNSYNLSRHFYKFCSNFWHKTYLLK